MIFTPQIEAYFAAKDGNSELIDSYFSDDIYIEDTGENIIIEGAANCKQWLVEKSKQYEMKTEIINTNVLEDNKVKVSVFVSGNFATGYYPFDYFFTILDEKIKAVKIVYTGN